MKRLAQKTLFIWLLAVVFLFSACGYKFGETRSEWAKSNRRLAIVNFTNSSHEFGAENIFTKAAAEVFIKRGGYRISTKDKCEIYLEGKILDIRESAATKRMESFGHRISSYNLTAEVIVKLFDKSGLLLWSGTVDGSTMFLGSINAIEFSKNKTNALEKLAKKLMDKSYTELSEDF